MGNRPSRRTFRNRLDELVQALKSDIAANKYPPGTYLPSENTLAEIYGLSGKSVAKGLSLLQDEGLIEKKHRIGALVKDPLNDKKVTLTLGYNADESIPLAELLEEFNKTYPSIEVITSSFEPYEHSSVKKYITSNKIDVFMVNYLGFQKTVEAGDLDCFEPLSVQPDTYHCLYKSFIVDDICYAQPLVFSPLVLYYNKDHFQDAGIPEPDSDWTWDTMMHYASLLAKKNERYGFYFHSSSENRWPLFLLQNGISFERQPSGKYQICGTEIMDVFEFYRDLFSNSDVVPPFFSENNSDAEMLFQEGKISMTISTYFGLNRLTSSALNYDIAPMPFFSEPSTLLLCIGLSVNRLSEKKESAKLLMQFLTSERAQAMIGQKSLSIPASRKIAQRNRGENELMFPPSRYNLFREIIPTYRYQKDLNLTCSAFETIRKQLKFYLSGMIDTKDMCTVLENLR